MDLNTVLMAGLIAYVSVGILGLYVDSRLYAHLRDHHPECWRALGEPRALRPATPGSLVGDARFLLRSKYRGLDDPKLNRLGDVAKLLMLASYGFLAIWIGLLLFGRFVL